ncbi:hypothetical protein HF1_09890 [Mycoplasma haemofelis str. Langford 1]|uniref:Uncharacterized protein n=1 Tax=Mycoplasma haemofelis (strain Langford 1) TaxID=941640 RepID=E8ZIM6_MYCHL|nr:hypothetical protein [Mycoplasma haemofelis]CBY92997.1 hypothetical protein HF1_09890 [Mycoplasma haemofelis str. Langford 1]
MAKLFPMIALSGLGAIGVSGWYGFSGLRPKDLKQYLEWQGFELASHASGHVWKSILDEHKEIVKSLIKNDSPTEKDIQDWCASHLSEANYESFKDDASKICVNNPQTVRAKIIQQSGDIKALIEGSEGDKSQEYKVAYIFRKHIEGLPRLIGFIPPEKSEGIEDGGKALGEWCKKSLESKPDDSLVSNVKALCSPKGFKTIEELIKKQGEENLLLTDGKNSSELTSKYNEIKDKDSWTKDDSKTSTQSTEEDLKQWCETHKSKNFYEEGTFTDVYPKFRFRCLKAS